MGVVLASGCVGLHSGDRPNWSTAVSRWRQGVSLTRGSEAKVVARTLRPRETRNRGPDSARIFGPETLPDAEPPPTSEKHPPTVRPPRSAPRHNLHSCRHLRRSRHPESTVRPPRSAPRHNPLSCRHLRRSRISAGAEEPRAPINPERPRPRSQSLARSRSRHRLLRLPASVRPGPNGWGSLREHFSLREGAKVVNETSRCRLLSRRLRAIRYSPVFRPLRGGLGRFFWYSASPSDTSFSASSRRRRRPPGRPRWRVLRRCRRTARASGARPGSRSMAPPASSRTAAGPGPRRRRRGACGSLRPLKPPVVL